MFNKKKINRAKSLFKIQNFPLTNPLKPQIHNNFYTYLNLIVLGIPKINQ